MPYFISGVTAEHTDLIARQPSEFKTLNDIDVRIRHRVVEIDAVNHTVRVEDVIESRKSEVPYTRLLIATGAQAIVPGVDGTGLSGVFTLRKLDDSVRIRQFIMHRRPRRTVVVGAGPVGLEMCESFRSLGMEVTLLEMGRQVMPLLDEDISARVQVHLETMGVECVLGNALRGIEGDADGYVRGVLLESGGIECDLVLLGIGVRPSADLAVSAGAELGVRGAVRVDRRMRTSAEDVFAAGDCATTTHSITGGETWIPMGSTSRKQGRVAAENMSGGDAEFPGVLGTAVVKCFDMTLGRTGLSAGEARDAGFDPVTVDVEAETLHSYYPGRGKMLLRLTADGAGGRLLGAQVAGSLRAAVDKRLDVLAMAIGAGMSSEDLQYADLAYAPPYSTVVDVPGIAGNVMSSKLRGEVCRCDLSGLE